MSIGKANPVSAVTTDYHFYQIYLKTCIFRPKI